jgi:ketosteroid isomerase-like protein
VGEWFCDSQRLISNSRKGNSMKSIISVVAAAALTFIASAIAQEESPSPATEEKASATVEETPAAAATEAATAKPAAEKSPAAAAERAASPMEVKKATAPAAAKAASPAAAPAAAAKPAKNMSVEATLKDMENRWAAAYLKHDSVSVEPMVATDFVGVNPKGKVQNRRAMLSDLKSNKDSYTSAKNEKLDVHRYGNDVAVVVGTYREKGSGKDSKTFDRTYRFTDTWMNRGGKWQCIASQLSLLTQK